MARSTVFASFDVFGDTHVQVVMNSVDLSNFGGHTLWSNTLLLPLFASVASLVVLSGQTIHKRLRPSKQTYLHSQNRESAGTRLKAWLNALGGVETALYQLTRLLASFALLGLSLHSVVLSTADRGKLDTEIVEWSLPITYLYASILSLLTVLVRQPYRQTVISHLVLVLLVPWLVFVYRDVWPLCTNTEIPLDGAQGALLWVHIIILTVAAVIVPLFSPRPYIPADPEDPFEPSEEQTTSWFSLATYSFCDRVILKAFRAPHIKLEELPKLNDIDATRILVKQAYPHVDPLLLGKRRHLAISLVVKVFPLQNAMYVLLVVLNAVTNLFAPIAVKNLLEYLEGGNKTPEVRPWVWIILLFCGPFFGTLTFNGYMYIAKRFLVQVQALLTQLIFDHSLRIRVKAETSESAPSAAAVTPEASVDPVNVSNQGATSDEAEEEAQESTPRESGGNDESSNSGTEASSSSSKGISASAQDKDTTTDKSKNLIGKINNLMTTDVDAVYGETWMNLVFFIPTQIGLSVYYLYYLLGWSALVGCGATAVLTVVPIYISKLMQRSIKEKMSKSDARVQVVAEAMNVIRMVKLFGWEQKMSDRLAEKREEELKAVRKTRLLDLANLTFACVRQLFDNDAYLHELQYGGTYHHDLWDTLVMKQQLSASRIFASVTVFTKIQNGVHTFFNLIPALLRTKVALDRLTDFLYETELLDQYTEQRSSIQASAAPTVDPSAIGIRQASFTWTADSTSQNITPGSGRRNFVLRVEDEVFFKRGCINLIVGQTGSGKTSLLMALLGEMHYIPSGPDSIVSLPRENGVAYHAQESWVLNATIKDNILFRSPFDEARYNAVLEQCALLPDLEQFDAGDETEVGERGITLSGGQKARVTLARAVYSSAEILLLDDVLAALDVHTARWIIDKCFKGSLIQGRTVILVTHNIAMASPLAEFVVSMGPDGRILSQGTLSNALAKDKTLSAELAQEQKAIEKDDEKLKVAPEPAQAKPKDGKGKLIVEEEVALGHVTWHALKLFLVNMQGKSGPFVFWFVFLLFAFICRANQVVDNWVLAMWANEYEYRDPAEVPVVYYLLLYCLVLWITVVTFAFDYGYYILGSLRASRIIHKQLVDSVLGSTLRWLDRTPISRVLTRCTQDIQTIDGAFQLNLYMFIDITFMVFTKFFAVIFISPVFIVPGAFLVVIGVLLGNVYMKGQLPVQREASNARAPVLGHISSTLGGLVSIRAYGAQESFRQEAQTRIDRYSRAERTYWHLSRWIGFRMDLLAALFAAALATYMTYGHRNTASATGFSLNMAVSFSGAILWWVRWFNIVETRGNSLERIQQYLEIEHEPKPTARGIPPAYWPASGDLRVEQLSARYSEDGPKVLQDITFHVKSGERVGIVGRTGSGKSSLTLALLRCILTEGAVYYDRIETSTINLDALRSNITIIPQIPELLSGTLRHNLDPLGEHDDAVLNAALRSAGLFSLQKNQKENRITLDTEIAGGGSNLSVGQRQVLALARALVRQSKLLILDEATSAIDYETDAVIQKSLRSELGKDVTLLTIAHRLQTIMDSDKILVLDSGRLVEFDKPSVLLKNEKSLLRALVEESGDKEALYAMANVSF
ncbi:P-loop containing nucleoside triphosphate hydrolase protein [Panus rudis PR-1116 ss-1]|nr:P-loop containing nucleoside triphosphate hydrolase protein [Panus rudis PR-1116 ss-1]